MYGVIRTATAAPGGLLPAEEILNRVEGEVVPRIHRLPGFLAYYVMRTTDDRIVTITFFDTAEGARESTALVREWAQHNREEFGDILIDAMEGAVDEGEVKLSTVVCREEHAPRHLPQPHAQPVAPAAPHSVA